MSAAGSFGFSQDISTEITGISLLDGDEITISDVVPDTYTVTEDDPTPAFDLTGVLCDDNDSTGSTTTRAATIVLAAGETVTCTFTNYEARHHRHREDDGPRPRAEAAGGGR